MSKVKICGLSREEDIEAVNAVMPDYAGFVFAESRRRIDETAAAMLKDGLDSRIEAVGVFVNEDIEKIVRLYRKETIDVVQLHGDEDAEYIRRLRNSCSCRIIKSVAVGDTLPYLPKSPDYLLFDTLSEERGGTGKTFDWHMLKCHGRQPYFLAGGLNAANVRDAIRTLSPYCVDVSGGVETHGLKDAAKIEEFVNIVRRAD
ncbi:MAG: phosphoribosylanthranilate isomerase [Candidatus Methanoplasma sp.]|jgi:phosphoribosylanthranilate isomerase|nr:phosphoribosylanthranilate isomerase [Candidatus Methanoplasma sp.]